MTTLSQPEWTKLFERWTPLELTGEVRLICAILGTFIADEVNSCRQLTRKREPFTDYFFDGDFRNWCRAIALDLGFVREMVLLAHHSEVRRPTKDGKRPETEESE